MARSVELGGKGGRFVVLASICVVVGALYFGREVFVPLALAILLSFLLTPAVRWLERWRFPRVAATLTVVLLAVAVVVVIGYVVGRQFASVIDQLPSYQGELRTKIEKIRSHGGFFRKLQHEAQNISSAATGTSVPGSQPAATQAATNPGGSGTIAPAAAPEPAHIPTTQYSEEHPLPVRVVQQLTPAEMLAQYATKVLDPLATAGLVAVFVIFMLLNREDLRDRIIRLVGHGRINLTTQALDDTGSRISRYLGALSIVNAAYGVCVATGLWVIGHFLGHGRGFPNVLAWGLLVALFRFVPYVGIWIGASVPLVLSFALFPGSAVFFATLGLFIALEVIVSQFVEPFWYGASTGMSALAVLVAAVFWTWLWGPIGLLLSTPLTVCLVVMGKYVPQLQFLDILLGDEPVLPPHVRLYQRLIAGDEEEASDLVHEMLKQKSLEEVFDEALLPALALAETDHHRGRLDDRRLELIHQGMRELVDELVDEERNERVRRAAAKTEQAAKEQLALPKRSQRADLPKDCTVNVLCLPARGGADEIAAMMLAHLLELRGYCATAVTPDSLASEMVELIEKRKADIVCVSAMPPAAVSHARYLCKRIHARFPQTVMVVGLWLVKGDLRKVKQRVSCAEPVPIVTTLEQAQHEIDQLAQPIIVRGANQAAPAMAK